MRFEVDFLPTKWQQGRMKARQTTVRGESCWVVPMGKKQGVARRIRIFGSTKEEALARAQEKLDELHGHGHTLGEIATTHRALIVEWRDRLTPAQMGEAFRKFVAGQCASRLVETAVSGFLAAQGMEKRKRGAVTVVTDAGKPGFSRQHAADTRYRLGKFSEAFAGRALDAINPGELETFVTSQAASARNFYKVLHAFFAYARRHRWIAVDPMIEVPRPGSGGGGEKAIFKPGQMKPLLQAAAGMIEGCERHEPTLALLVLGGLCGLRYSEALRLRWEQVDLETGEIHLDKLKTAKRGVRARFVEILPSASAWLATLSADDGGRVVRVNDKNARLHRARVLRAAKLKAWPHNALRRSWGSYHLAAFENGDLTAAQMGHTSAETTFAKYRTLARKTEGEAWFALTPTKVAELENVIEFKSKSAAR